MKDRKETILDDMRKTLHEQRSAQEALYTAKKKRVVLEHSANAKKAHYKVLVTKVRGIDGRPVYGSDPKIEAKVEECLSEDETYQSILDLIQKVDEEIFTNKLDYEYLQGEFTVLKVEAALMAV